MKNNIAIICARSGSKGIKNKNVKLLNGKPLIAWSIELAKKNKLIKDIYVSTDSKKIASISSNYGAKIPFIRPKNLSLDNSKEWDVLRHFIKYLNNKNIKISALVNLPCTSPLKKQIDINKAIKKYYQNKYDVVISVTNSHRNPMFNMTREIKKYASIAIDSKKKFYNRQEAPTFFDMTTNVYIYSPKYLLNYFHLFDGKVGQILIPKKRSIDIDNIEDFELCEYLISKNGH